MRTRTYIVIWFVIVDCVGAYAAFHQYPQPTSAALTHAHAAIYGVRNENPAH
jgi:hypothetical protein